MKDLETTKQVQIETENHSVSVDSLEFSEIVVYNEMADQTSVKLNLIDQIYSQLNQLEELSQKRRFMMKEVMNYIVE